MGEVEDQGVGDLVDPVRKPEGHTASTMSSGALDLDRVDVDHERQQRDDVPLELVLVAQQVLSLHRAVGHRGHGSAGDLSRIAACGRSASTTCWSNDGRGAGKLSARAVVREAIAAYRAHWLFLILMPVVILLPQALADGFLNHLQLEGIRDARDLAILAATPLTVVITSRSGLRSRAHGGRGDRAARAPSSVDICALLKAVPIKRLIALDLILAFGSALGFLLLVIPAWSGLPGSACPRRSRSSSTATSGAR